MRIYTHKKEKINKKHIRTPTHNSYQNCQKK